MNRNDWLEERRKGIGGTDVAAICGVHPYRTALDVYLDKLGIAPATEENEAMHWGHVMEPIIADEVMRRTGVQFVKSDFVRDSINPIICGTPDYEHPDRKIILECKTAGLRQAAKWDDVPDGFVPDEYFLQSQYYLEIKGYDEAWLAVLIGGNDFRMYTLKRSLEIGAGLKERAMKFWRDHIETMTPPPLDASESSKAWLRHAFPRNANDNICPATEHEEDMMNLVAGWKHDMDKAETEFEAAKNRLCELIGSRAGLIDSTGRKVTWKAAKDSDRVDWKAVASDPRCTVPLEVIAQNTTIQQGSRRFLITESKQK